MQSGYGGDEDLLGAHGTRGSTTGFPRGMVGYLEKYGRIVPLSRIHARVNTVFTEQPYATVPGAAGRQAMFPRNVAVTKLSRSGQLVADSPFSQIYDLDFHLHSDRDCVVVE